MIGPAEEGEKDKGRFAATSPYSFFYI